LSKKMLLGSWAGQCFFLSACLLEDCPMHCVVFRISDLLDTEQELYLHMQPQLLSLQPLLPFPKAPRRDTITLCWKYFYRGLLKKEGNGNTLQYFCLENSMDRGAWQTVVHGVAELDTTEWLTDTHTTH